jgi:hypothetical protein
VWPANLATIYFDGDACLHDPNGTLIPNQCCRDPTDVQTPNPYMNPLPAVTCEGKPSGSDLQFIISGKGWANTGTDTNAKLQQEVESCHELLQNSGWVFVHKNTPQTDMSTNHIGEYEAEFTATIRMNDQHSKYHAGCVQKAIINAGGPALASGNCITFSRN